MVKFTIYARHPLKTIPDNHWIVFQSWSGHVGEESVAVLTGIELLFLGHLHEVKGSCELSVWEELGEGSWPYCSSIDLFQINNNHTLLTF